MKGTFSLAATALAVVVTTAMPAAAQDYPTATVRIVVPFPPGGSTDIVGRLLANHLGEAWKQTVVVENRPGGNGMLGPTFVARSKPDGYTLLLAAPSIATAVTSMKDMPINPEKDLDGVSQLISTDYAVAVNSKQPMKTLKELIDAAKANPGKLNYGFFAVGSRLTTEYFSTLAGIKMNAVGYKGENPMVTALASGEVQVGLSTIAAMREFANRGEVRILAITGAKRSPVFPDVPTAAEAGLPAFDSSVWFGMFAPAGTPAAIKNKVSQEIGRFVQQPEVIAKMESFGLTPKASTPEQMSRHLSQDIKRAVDTAKLAGIEPQ
jgi:tripartite-type tricarboxylate transporter receptor subunit TctC